MRECKGCRITKGLDAFYASNASRCKECVKASVRANRAANLDHYREFDRLRANEPHRVAARRAYMQTEAGQTAHARAVRKYRSATPERTRARSAVARAIRKGTLIPWPCEVCGNQAEAHHPHYGAPLLVTWLCPDHHKQVHADNQ